LAGEICTQLLTRIVEAPTNPSFLLVRLEWTAQVFVLTFDVRIALVSAESLTSFCLCTASILIVLCSPRLFFLLGLVPLLFLNVLLLHPLISLPPRFFLVVGFRSTRVP
jgi:hypothetical protein